jgi:hypothetical protein
VDAGRSGTPGGGTVFDETYADDVRPLIIWAQSNPGSKLRGKMDYRPRLLGTIAEPDKIFRD